MIHDDNDDNKKYNYILMHLFIMFTILILGVLISYMQYMCI